MNNHAILAWCERQSGWLRETIEALARLESPTTDKAAVDRCGEELAKRLTESGGRVERIRRTECGDLVRARFGGPGSPVLLLGHFDTVWPVGQLRRMPLREEGGCLYGPGIFDMKAGIAVAMLALRALSEHGERIAPPVVMLWTTDEETGSTASRDTLETEARASRSVLVLEPSLPGGAVKTSRKGCGEFELTVHGIAAHAGVDPRKGASAIHELARQIVAIEGLADLDRGISVNVGVIAGGSRGNVVAEEAHAIVDVRVPTAADGVRIEQALRSLRPTVPGTRLEVAGEVGRPPLERSAGVARLYELARDVARQLGRDLQEGATGGGSDGNFTAAIGVPTLDGLGPQGDGAHALHEHVVLEDLPWRAALVAGLLIRLASPNALQ